MHGQHTYFEFVHLPTYRRSSSGMIDDECQRELEQTLCADPERGDVMVGTGGVRKVRVALPGAGKSGGARVVYYYRESKGRIYLILAFAKGRKANLTKAERNEMRKLTAILEGER